MTVGMRPTTRDINAAIVEDYFEVPMSVASLSEKYGRHVSSISKTIKAYKDQYQGEHGCERPRNGKPHDPRKTGNPKTISIRHYWVGMAVSRFIDENGLTVTSFGHLISRSPNKVTRICQGIYPLTLEDVSIIAHVLNVDFNSLLNPVSDERRAA